MTGTIACGGYKLLVSACPDEAIFGCWRNRPAAAQVSRSPTNRSQRITLTQDCPDVLARLRSDGADAAVIVPNCPVCHQTAGLTACYLERNGLPTVIMGCAKDIIEHVGVPRFLFSDFPSAMVPLNPL